MFIRLILSLFLLSFSLSSFASHGEKSLSASLSSHHMENAKAMPQAAGHDRVNMVNHDDCTTHFSADADCSSLCAFPSMITWSFSDNILASMAEKQMMNPFSIPYMQYPKAPLRPPSVGFSFPS